ncbi:hypothetical protein LY632_03530 [Erythrobacter sp. SDW2]|uniref:hypothetical protein n=1 Tax=Erythrobacter sp. SDW2 TaxID=2907154 RepID=UPI001F273018|nr:hypothetical protein [Erythrobacter sp. SDW2]UIP07482.1 hypothetical protein LY632_03530 [Erythrobacter sp. SDW2]
MRLAILAPIFGAIALSACGGEPAETPEPGTTVGEEAGAELTGLASTYTALDLDKCQLVSEQAEEGTSAEWRCEGFGDLPLLVSEGDGRFDLDAGVKNEAFETIGAFNSLGDNVEWRLRDGKPFAVIFRYLDATEEAKGRTVLAVEKVGTAATTGCRVAQVAGDVPDANQVARDLADSNAADFTCGTTEMALAGNAQ